MIKRIALFALLSTGMHLGNAVIDPFARREEIKQLTLKILETKAAIAHKHVEVFNQSLLHTYNHSLLGMALNTVKRQAFYSSLYLYLYGMGKKLKQRLEDCIAGYYGSDEEAVKTREQRLEETTTYCNSIFCDAKKLLLSSAALIGGSMVLITKLNWDARKATSHLTQELNDLIARKDHLLLLK